MRFITAMFLLAAIALGGCASTIMKGYVDRPISDVVEDYGMPSGAYDLGDGVRAFVWQMSKSYTMPSFSSGQATVIGSQVFANSYTSPGITSTSTCSYVFRAKRTRTDIEGPAAWTIVSFKAPPLKCE